MLISTEIHCLFAIAARQAGTGKKAGAKNKASSVKSADISS
jgi:hypothetical protein